MQNTLSPFSSVTETSAWKSPSASQVGIFPTPNKVKLEEGASMVVGVNGHLQGMSWVVNHSLQV
eukprot:CAMPEP_0184310546 /NCGR_PEP_ID=MMETSP1049-20130417/31129_1 /TAXON_ID=77928 /ORGANISM="Proteomonas sulcata, Strain CCMP704" /LENGTH=63 /DNA_ID=CAMNT_0026624859 /DNA_START=295 /DNA_END=486 /DNA_ORIENTATION=-